MNSTEPEYCDQIRYAQASRDRLLTLNMTPVRSQMHFYPWNFKNREAQRRFEWYLELQAANVHRSVVTSGTDLTCSCGLIVRNTQDEEDMLAAPGHLDHREESNS